MARKTAVPDEWTVVDFAVHLHPRSVAADPPPGSDLVGPGRIHDPETQRAELATAGVDAAVLSQPLFMSHDDDAATAAANDELYSVVEAYDEFYGLGAIPTAAGGSAAAAEFERCLEKGFHGGSVTTGRESDSLASRDLEPVFDVAERCDAPIFVHVPPRRQSEFKMDVVLSREHSLAESIYEAINAGVFDRHPELNLVYHHFGGNIAGMMGHIDLHLDEGRWPGQDDLKSPAAFRTQLCENVSVDTAGFFGYPGPLRSALEEFPAENVLFGSDYPWELRDPGELSGAVETVVASTNHVDARKILGENALNVLCNVD